MKAVVNLNEALGGSMNYRGIPLRLPIVAAAVVVLGIVPREQAAGQARAQADVQIQAFSVQLTKMRGSGLNRQLATPGVTIDLTVFSNNDDDANGSRVQVFLPPETGILTVPAGCTPMGAGTGVKGTYHAYLTCDLGSIPVNGTRTIQFTVSAPPSYITKRYGAFAYSETPDPFTGNNYAERTLP